MCLNRTFLWVLLIIMVIIVRKTKKNECRCKQNKKGNSQRTIEMYPFSDFDIAQHRFSQLGNGVTKSIIGFWVSIKQKVE